MTANTNNAVRHPRDSLQSTSDTRHAFSRISQEKSISHDGNLRKSFKFDSFIFIRGCRDEKTAGSATTI
jgi:hypothetical protein